MTPVAKTILVSTLWLYLLSSSPVFGQSARPCTGSPWNAMAELAGEFVVEAAGQPVGKAHIRSIADGCGLIQELRIGEHSVFYTINIDPASGQWQEQVVISDNTIAQGEGQAQLAKGSLQSLTTTGRVSRAAGASRAYHTHYKRTAAGDLQLSVEVQEDDQWTEAFNVVLVDVAGPSSKGAPSTQGEETRLNTSTPTTQTTESQQAKAPAKEIRATRVSSAPTPPPEESTRPLKSSTKQQTVLSTASANTRVSKIIVESPMLVELPLGPIDKLPKGYAWRSADLAQYEIDSGTIEQVEVEKQSKRGKTRLLVTFYGSSEAFTAEYRITIHLRSAADAVLSESVTGKLYTGRAVSSQINKGVSASTLEIQLEDDAFANAFAQEQRPVLFIQVEALG